jgi:hypothetical protein
LTALPALSGVSRLSIARRQGQLISIARRTGIPLKIAAKVDRADQEYFDLRIACLIDGSLVELIGEITEVEKPRFLAQLRFCFPSIGPNHSASR